MGDPSAREQNFWGSLILQLRTEQGMSQRSLCLATGVGRSTLRHIESGEAKGDIYTVERLLEHLGYELDAIFVEPPQKPTIPFPKG